MRTLRIPAWALAATLAAGCGQAAPPATPAPSGIRATVVPGGDLQLVLPAAAVRLVFEVRPGAGLQAQALPGTAATVEVSITGGTLPSAYTQTIQAAQFINNTAQIVISGLHTGTYKVTATVKNSAGGTIVSGYMDVGVVAGQATSANLVLIYGSPGDTSTLTGSADFLAPAVTITSIGIDPAALPGPGYPARITVTTNRADQDGLRFHYAADGGAFSGDGAEVLWIAPQASGGTFGITVRVDDGAHTPVTASVSATVPSGAGAASGTASFSDFS